MHQAFANGLGAGLTAEQSLQSMGDLFDKHLVFKLQNITNSVRKGKSLVSSLNDQGLLSPFDYSLLSTGEKAGTLDRMHGFLAKNYEASFLRQQRLRSQMMMPLFVAIFALFVLPIPALFSGDLSIAGYISRILTILIGVFILIKLLQKLITDFNNNGWPEFLIRLGRLLPSSNRLIMNSCRAKVISNLAIMQEAGIPAIESFEIAVKENSGLSKTLASRAKNSLAGNSSVSEALMSAELLDGSEGFPIVSAGEAAGRLAESLTRYAESCQHDADSSLNFITFWLPKIFYFWIIFMIAKNLI